MFASDNGVSIKHVDAAARSIILSGQLKTLVNLFPADLQMREVDSQTIRTRTGAIRLPAELEGIVSAVLGFDQRPIARTYHRFQPDANQPLAYTPKQVAQAYAFPNGTGANQTIALIELGGGFKSADLQKYWRQLSLNNVTVSAVSVDGAGNAPTGDPDGPDGEVMLDIEVAGAVAPNAKIAVYFAPNTDQGFLDAINAAIHDQNRKPSVISISWGGPEDHWTPQALDAFNAAFHDAALLGISVCAAAGDSGSSDGESSGNHVDFPASSPYVLACGGTKLVAANGTITSETVWNDGTQGGATGGGVSAYFAKPSYQSGVSVPAHTSADNAGGRGVPDVSGVADPETGYKIIVDGEQGVIGGTSAVAPLWAGLIALLNQQLGKNIGWFQPQLYGALTQHKCLRDIVSGTNGAFKAVPGWDPCTGLGSPNGQAMLNTLKPSPK
jgi:kumamolisin